VLFVVSCLAVAGHGAEAGEDEALRARLEARLEGLADRDGAEIRVAVRDGRVLLRGRVRLLEQSLRAEQTAWKTVGVEDVENELRVVPVGGAGDAAIERRIRTIIKGDERFVDTSLELEVRTGRVRLRGMFNDPVDVLAMKHRIASIPGVLDVEIDAVLVARRGESGRAPGSA
jgi:osmotically-inducible protein OsmY